MKQAKCDISAWQISRDSHEIVTGARRLCFGHVVFLQTERLPFRASEWHQHPAETAPLRQVRYKMFLEMCFMLFDLRYGTMNSLERYFRWHGKLVARQAKICVNTWFLFLIFSSISYPVLFLLGSLMSTLILGLGLVSFREEHDLTKLWVPEGSRLRNNVEWVQENFPQQLRWASHHWGPS